MINKLKKLAIVLVIATGCTSQSALAFDLMKLILLLFS